MAAERGQRRGGAGPWSREPGGGPARAVLKAAAGDGPAVLMALPSAARALRAAVRRCDHPSRPRSTPSAAPRGFSPAAAGTGPRPGPPPPPQGAERDLPPAVDFGDPREAFRSKSNAELLRGLVVLGLCALEPLVQHNREVGGGRGLPRWGCSAAELVPVLGVTGSGPAELSLRGRQLREVPFWRGFLLRGVPFWNCESQDGSAPSGRVGAEWEFCRSRGDCSKWGDISFRENACFAGCWCVPGVLSLGGVARPGLVGLSP